LQLHAAIDEFVLYIEIEKNYSVNTVTSYEYDLQLFLTFLSDHGCSTCLNEITKTQVRRFIQHLLGSLKQKPPFGEPKNLFLKIVRQILFN